MNVRIVGTRWSGALGRGAQMGILGAALLLVGACGGEDSASRTAGEESGERPPVSAEREDPEGMGAADTGRPPEVSECLDLVEAEDYEQARSVCAEAARAAPENTEVQEALREARASAGEAADPARESTEGAAGEAERGLDESSGQGP